MPDIENSRKTAERGAEWGHSKQPEKPPEEQPKHPKNSQNSCFWVFRQFFRLFFGCFTVTQSAPFSAV